MTAKEFITKWYLYGYPTASQWEDDIEEILQEFAKLKCTEQRQICADNAELNISEWGDSRTIKYTDFGEEFVEVDRNSILNAFLPEI